MPKPDIQNYMETQSQRSAEPEPVYWYRAALRAAKSLSRPRTAIAASLLSLQRGLTGERGKIASDYMDQTESLQAYLSYYWPVSFFEMECIFKELSDRSLILKPARILDAGSGPGPASCSAAHYSAVQNWKIQQIVLMDRSRHALDAARRIFDDMLRDKNQDRTPDRPAGSSSASEEPQIITLAGDLEHPSLLDEIPRGGFDLIIASHSINELWHGKPDAIARRKEFVARLFPFLSEHGILLIVEPSAHYTSIPLLALRDALLEPAAAASLQCIAPCTHSGPCPLRQAGERPCFSEWQWMPPAEVRALAELAGLDRTSLKASWIAFGRDELETRPNSQLHGRIISEPLRNKAGRIRFIVCTQSGLVTLSAAQDSPDARRLGFFELSRGCLIEADGLERRGESHFGILACTRLKVVLRPPRC